MKKPTITVKQYEPNGNYALTTTNAVGGLVKGLLVELAPSFYPNGERAYPSIRIEVNQFINPVGVAEQVEAIAGWCERVKGGSGVLAKRAESVYAKCIEFLSAQKRIGFNVYRRKAA